MHLMTEVCMKVLRRPCNFWSSCGNERYAKDKSVMSTPLVLASFFFWFVSFFSGNVLTRDRAFLSPLQSPTTRTHRCLSLYFWLFFFQSQGPFVGIIGFSQGGMLSSALAGLQLQQKKNNETVKLPFKVSSPTHTHTYTFKVKLFCLFYFFSLVVFDQHCWTTCSLESLPASLYRGQQH